VWQFGNTITDALGYAVSINGQDDIPLIAPDFSYTHSIEAGYEGEIELSVTLGGVRRLPPSRSRVSDKGISPRHHRGHCRRSPRSGVARVLLRIPPPAAASQGH